MPSHHVSRRTLPAASALVLALGTGLGASVALATAAGAAAPAATAAVSDNDRELSYTAAPGQANKVAVTETLQSNRVDITYVIDDVVPISAGHGCSYPDRADHTKVSCTVVTVDSQDPYNVLTLNAADGNDVVAVNNTTDQAYYTNSIHLGAGNDKLTNTGPVDGSFVLGEGGDDSITVGEVAVAFGGDGNDTVYAGSDGIIVQGGKGNDVIRGGAGGQSLSGDDGNDRVYGGTGDDSLNGGKGNDLLYGNSGRDRLYGNSGDDKLYGGAGRDTLSGGPGRDVIRQD
ncbi:calcium-binding protein [Streptomyces albus subsp. albus]|nr:calcium-binding protein [Streptomyces albus subsp. albus]